MITELSHRATLTAVSVALLLASISCSADSEPVKAKPEKLTEGYSWRFTGSIGKGRFTGDDDIYSEREVPTSIQESQTAIEVSTGYKFSQAIWINTGFRKYSEEELNYCDQYNEDDCLRVSSDLFSAWTSIGYHFYPILKDFQFEVGLHFGLISNQYSSDLGSSSSLNDMLKFTIAVPYRERWLIQYSAENSRYEDGNAKDVGVTTQLISASYLY